MLTNKMEHYTQKFLSEYMLQTSDAINNLGKGKAHLIDFNPRTKQYEIVTRFITPEEKEKFKVNTVFQNFDKALFEVEKTIKDLIDVIKSKSCDE